MSGNSFVFIALLLQNMERASERCCLGCWGYTLNEVVYTTSMGVVYMKRFKGVEYACEGMTSTIHSGVATILVSS